MILCENCGQDIEEGKNFCPHCGKPVEEGAAAPASVTALQTHVERPRQESAPTAAPLSSFEKTKDAADGSRRVAFTVMAIASVVIVGTILLLLTPVGVKLGLRSPEQTAERRLEGAVRPGSPEFEQVRGKLVVEFDPDEDATIGANALGNFVVTMKPTVRNFTGRTVSGLEFHVAGLDLGGQTIRERFYINTEEIENNKISQPPIPINFPQDNRPAQLKLELTGIRFK